MSFTHLYTPFIDQWLVTTGLSKTETQQTSSHPGTRLADRMRLRCLTPDSLKMDDEDEVGTKARKKEKYLHDVYSLYDYQGQEHFA